MPVEEGEEVPAGELVKLQEIKDRSLVRRQEHGGISANKPHQPEDPEVPQDRSPPQERTSFMFLTATLMPNTIEDLKCFLKLNWQEDWRDDANHSPNKPWHAIGLFSRVPASSTDSDQSQPTSDLVTAPPIKAILNPLLFHRLLDKESGMDSDVASNYLPAVMKQISMRRTMSSVICAYACAHAHVRYE